MDSIPLMLMYFTEWIELFEVFIVKPFTSTECKAVFADCKTDKLKAEYSEKRYVRTVYSKPKDNNYSYICEVNED